MNKNLYSILGVDRDASDEDLKRSYKKLVFKWHPDKNPHQRDVAEERIKEINEAYNILHNFQTRGLYDSVSDGMVSSRAPGAQPFNGMASQLFADLLSGAQFSGRPVSKPNAFEELFTATFRQTSSSFTASTYYAQTNPSTNLVELALNLTLEELYNGCVKRLTLSRKRLDATTSQQINVQEILEIPVKPGWREGTRVKFAGKGDEMPGQPAADVVFVVKEQLHPCFERHGNDLHATIRVPLVTALTGGSVAVHMLDGRRIDMDVTDMLTPNSRRVLQGEGMPITKTPGQKGDLHLTFIVEFPQDLDELQRMQLRCVLTRQPLPPATEIAGLPMPESHTPSLMCAEPSAVSSPSQYSEGFPGTSSS